MHFQDLLHFVRFIDEFRRIERKEYFVDTDRMECDGEHSFQLAMVAWYVMNAEQLSLDMTKVLKYCLAHDLVETYAGDTPVLDERGLETKHEREAESFLRIRAEFGNKFPDLTDMIDGYEGRADAEAKFVHALDKVVPVLNAVIGSGRTWKELYGELEIEQALLHKESVIEDELTGALLQEAIQTLRETCPELFER